MRKVYVVSIDESYDSQQYSYVLGVFATKELAKKRFEEQKADIKANSNFDTEDEEENSWATYNEGWYSENHYAITIEEQNVEGGENIEIEDINLVDDATATGGKANSDETLSDFLKSADFGNLGMSLREVNDALVECGIEPITDEQIIFRGGK